MGATIECKKCKKTYRYDSSELVNTGTIWHPIWTVNCRNCGAVNSFTTGKDEIFDKPLYKKEGVAFESPKPDGITRAKSGDIREYWIQLYVKDNYAKLGFSKLTGPYDTGPDFKGEYKNKNVLVEVERACRNYIEHGHHTDDGFKDVDVLIVLSPDEPSEEIKSKLPKTIIYMNIDDFVEYWRPKARDYAVMKRGQAIVKAVAGEFQRRFIANCNDKDRDMITCPDCDLCPYFGEGVGYDAQGMFESMALKFLATYPSNISSEDFKLSNIEPSEIDKFYLENI